MSTLVRAQIGGVRVAISAPYVLGDGTDDVRIPWYVRLDATDVQLDLSTPDVDDLRRLRDALSVAIDEHEAQS